MTTWTWMRHPETGGVQKFADAAVSAWKAEGWEPCDPPEPDNLAVGAGHPLLAQPTDSPADPVDDPADATPAPAVKTRRAPAEIREE